MLLYGEQHWIDLHSRLPVPWLCPLIIYIYVMLFLGMRTKQQNCILPETRLLDQLTNLGLVTFESGLQLDNTLFRDVFGLVG